MAGGAGEGGADEEFVGPGPDEDCEGEVEEEGGGAAEEDPKVLGGGEVGEAEGGGVFLAGEGEEELEVPGKDVAEPEDEESEDEEIHGYGDEEDFALEGGGAGVEVGDVDVGGVEGFC